MWNLATLDRTTLKWLVFVLTLTVCAAAGATVYYVDAVNGNDGSAGTSQSSPWKTLNKVSNFSLKPGDSVLFKRGCAWRETLVIPTSGTASARITFGAYGTGDKPLIIGSDPVTGWISQGANIWQAALSANPGSVWLESGGVASWGTPRDALSALAAQGDWTWSSGNLYLYSTTNPATAYSSVEAASRDYGILGWWGRNSDYITIQDFEVKFTKHYLVSISFAGNLTSPSNDYWIVERVTAHHDGVSKANDGVGLNVHGVGHLIRNNTVYETIDNGIYVGVGGNTVVEYNTSYNNHHHEIDVKSQVGYPCDNNIVRYNLCYESGMAGNVYGFLWPSGYTNQCNGIYVGAATGTKVYYNVVYGLSDKGIQIGGAGNTTEGIAINTEVYNNVVTNCAFANYYLDCVDNKVILKNNVGVNPGGNSIVLRVVDVRNKTIDDNCWRVTSGTFAAIGSSYTTYSNWTTYKSATGFDAHSKNTDPVFLNAANKDFHLQPTSPCKDAGADVGLTKDFDGTAVPQSAGVDLGAFELAQQAPDTTTPVITLLGQPTVTIEVGATYTDAGATATDDRDGDITSRIVKGGSVNTAAVATYTLTYDVSDTAGNAATQVVRTVKVVDTTKPVISLVGSAAMNVEVGTSFTDPGATAQDNYDGNITSRIVVTSNVNPGVVGDYTVTYNVSDAAGNAAAPVTRTVSVRESESQVQSKDTAKPVITLLGSPTVTVEVLTTYTDAGATAMDNVDGDITPRIVKGGNVNTSKLGTYTVTYDVSDAAGNAATQVVRTVTVVDTTKPVITPK
jgi:hypothetical protein